jgi:polyhydroxyalkanoate synthesis regulator phasin
MMPDEEHDRIAGYVADVLERAKSERVTRAMIDHVVRDMQKIRENNDFWQAEVHKLLSERAEIKERLRALEEAVRKLKGGA